MNVVILKGNLASDPELRATTTGKNMAVFTVRCQRYNKEVDFIPCMAWEKTAEFVKNYFAKGSPILVRGSLQVRKYQDKNGNNRTATEVVVSEAEFAGRSEGKGESKPESKPSTSGFEEITDIGDLPF